MATSLAIYDVEMDCESERSELRGFHPYVRGFKGFQMMAANDASATTAGELDQATADTDTLSVIRRIADRFVQTYTLEEEDPDFGHLFADSVQIWHSFDQETMSLSGKEFAAAMIRMLRATAEIVHDHRDQVWSLKVDNSGFALAATASGELEGGIPISIARCLLVTVDAARITHIFEFGDLHQRAPLDDALRAAGRFRA